MEVSRHGVQKHAWFRSTRQWQQLSKTSACLLSFSAAHLAFILGKVA